MEALRFGLVGFGHFGKHYARLLGAMSGVELVAVANRSTEMFELNRQYLSTQTIQTVDAVEVINNPTIDCLIVATPPSTHVSLIKSALQAGKHVLVEKPMVLDLAEAATLVPWIGQSTVMVAFQYVYNDYIRALKELIKSDRLGKVSYVLAQNWYFGPLRRDIGSFADAAGHELSMIEYLFSPGAIKKSSYQSFSIATPGVDDFSTATIEYVNGLRAHVTASWFVPEKSRQMIVVGDKSVAVFNDTAPTDKLKLYDRPYPTTTMEHSSDFMKELAAIPPEVVSVQGGEPLQTQLEHFVDCVRSGQKPETGFGFGQKIVAKMEAIQQRA